MVRLSAPVLAALGLFANKAFGALEVNLDDPESIKKAAAQVAEDLLTFYHGDEPGWVPGILPGPPPDGDYYWWQGGAMWGTLLDYRHNTGDTQYDDMITTAMLHQAGDDRDYLPSNWSASMGNDDQAFWALSAMLATEIGYTDPPEDQPQWAALAQAVFHEQTSEDRRVPSGRCKWGLRWQVYSTNNGYDYINTIANACYFNIGSRLARYFHNETYAELATKTWDLIDRLGYISDKWDVYDGAHLPDCTDLNKAQFSYNAAMLLQGAAFMYNYTDGAQIWKDRVDNLVDRMIEIFFPAPARIAFEPSCEYQQCNSDMESFKGFTHRWMGTTMQVAPHTKEKILPVLKQSTAGAVKQCTGGNNGRFCGFHWTSGVWDGDTGASQQMNVLGALVSLLAPDVPAPLTKDNGGTSKGNVNAGSNEAKLPTFAPITSGDKVGAGIVTALIIAGSLSAFAWMSLD
ncbi:glycoside hydrolase family 76 protein [Daldinia caldariorum]|uniref:glycoside hydrolase family 76 protein n=1 Tax=Daldinia caldariorum TaxID=326644 RepID=UPI002008AACC|nr:glycoside hydrolase family 76 protein [Daldinia caldariorum]KAI1464386.1 glycoside hydrolase family 76 protein [Daldinia caldariorum]